MATSPARVYPKIIGISFNSVGPTSGMLTLSLKKTGEASKFLATLPLPPFSKGMFSDKEIYVMNVPHYGVNNAGFVLDILSALKNYYSQNPRCFGGKLPSSIERRFEKTALSLAQNPR